jgi:succinoglycan biosynthesis protein ExoO
MPDVTVAIACYNCEGTVEAAIRSALDQEGVTVEVVAADDCSSDGTAAVIAAIGDPRVRYVRLPENRGPGGARNVALEHAGSDWFAVLDADDTMAPGRLRGMTALGRARKAEIVCDNIEIREAGKPPRPMFDAESLAGLVGLDRFIRSNRLFAGEHNYGYLKPLVSMAFLRQHGVRYDEAVRIGEDYLFLADCLSLGAALVLDREAGYRYTVAEGSISRRLLPGHVAAMMAADARFLQRRGALLGDTARAAQAERTRSLERAADFLDLVGALKARKWSRAAGIALRNPAAARHLSMPLAKRLGFSGQPRRRVGRNSA